MTKINDCCLQPFFVSTYHNLPLDGGGGVLDPGGLQRHVPAHRARHRALVVVLQLAVAIWHRPRRPAHKLCEVSFNSKVVQHSGMESNLKKHRSNPKGLKRTHENHIFIAFVSSRGAASSIFSGNLCKGWAQFISFEKLIYHKSSNCKCENMKIMGWEEA